jgi:hypothetical protein
LALSSVTYGTSSAKKHNYRVYIQASTYTTCETLPDKLVWGAGAGEIDSQSDLETELSTNWGALGENESGARLFTEDGETQETGSGVTYHKNKSIAMEIKHISITEGATGVHDVLWADAYNEKVNVLVYDCEDLNSIVVFYGMRCNLNSDFITGDVNSITLTGSVLASVPTNYFDFQTVTA